MFVRNMSLEPGQLPEETIHGFEEPHKDIDIGRKFTKRIHAATKVSEVLREMMMVILSFHAIKMMIFALIF